jgi:hypothetical protein
MINECEAVGGIRIGRGKPAPVPLLAPKIPYYLTGDRIQVALMVCRRLTANTSNVLFRDKLIVAQIFNQFPV